MIEHDELPVASMRPGRYAPDNQSRISTPHQLSPTGVKEPGFSGI
jgi:hypothetical protein